MFMMCTVATPGATIKHVIEGVVVFELHLGVVTSILGMRLGSWDVAYWCRLKTFLSISLFSGDVAQRKLHAVLFRTVDLWTPKGK